MNKELARYFFMLINKDLQFSFNGMGLPNNTCEWLENQLMQENFDKVEEFIKLRYAEQNNKRIKKKHKFRAMTKGEYCDKWLSKHKYCVPPDRTERCPLFPSETCLKENGNKPLVINGKYILIKVKE